MGLYKQPNHWTCGPFALKHALVALGKIASERTISRIAKTHWWSGTDEVRLARAARAYECDLPLIRRVNADRARRTLISYVSKGIPVLVCVDNWEHWITVVAHEGGRFVIVDSRTDPVLDVMEWPQFRTRWKYTDESKTEGPATIYDLHPVKPRFRVEIPARFSVKRAQYLRRPENLDLARHWEEYLSDLLEVCKPRRVTTGEALSMGEFLRRHQDLLVQRVRHWHGYVEKDEVEHVLKHYRFVAETYGLVIPVASQRRALADVAILLTLWCAASRGVNPIYGSDTKKRKRRRR